LLAFYNNQQAVIIDMTIIVAFGSMNKIAPGSLIYGALA